MNQPRDEDANRRPGCVADRHAAFLRLYTRHQYRILAYIFTLVPNRSDAEDLLQETSMLLWEKFDQFEPGTDFTAWACRVAFLKVSDYRRQFVRAKLVLSNELLESIAARAIELAPHLDQRRRALNDCLKRLEERDRLMILARYEPGGSVDRAARTCGRSLQATYKALYRIRKALFDCVSLRVAEEGAG